MKGARVRGVRQPIGAGQVVGNPNTAGSARPQVLTQGDIARLTQSAGVGRPGAIGANPTAIAGDIAINGSAATFTRSDAAPAVQKGLSSQFGIVKVDGTTIISVAGVISATGGGGSSFTTVTKTANYTLLTTDSGKHFNNIGAAGDIVLSLPAAAANLIYGFAVFAAHYIKILVNGTDQIAIGPSNGAAGGYLRFNVPFAFVQLEAHGAGQWIVSSLVGSWNQDE